MSAAPSVAHAIAATLDAAGHSRTPWRCVAADLPELAPGSVGGWHVAVHSLTHAATPQLVIGVIADAGGADPKTLAALGRMRAKLDAAQVELVLVLGGMATTEPELEATLGVLAKPTSPVIALPGDLEAVGAETAAIAALTAKGNPVIDGRLVRWIELPEVTIGTVAGTGSVLRLAAGGEGCAWHAEDVVELYQELAARPGLRIAALAEAPREGSSGELDLAAPAIDLVLHGPTQPAPSAAQAGGRDGAHVGLSPGTAGATPRLPETRPPAAGLLTLRGTAWSWKPLLDK
ncbi:MAG: hypothetical protein ABI591_00775 [Kofleriaceae bacterium]